MNNYMMIVSKKNSIVLPAAAAVASGYYKDIAAASSVVAAAAAVSTSATSTARKSSLTTSKQQTRSMSNGSTRAGFIMNNKLYSKNRHQCYEDMKIPTNNKMMQKRNESNGSSVKSSSISSKRGRDAVKLLPTYLADARKVEKFCPTSCPDGALQLGIAENQMLEDMLVPVINECSSANDFAADCIYYQSTHGRESLRQEISTYLQRLLNLSYELDIEGLVIGAGCNAVLENLCFCLAEGGNDAVLIPTPYYAAFEFDLVARAGLTVLPVTTMDYHDDDPTASSENSIDIQKYYPNRKSLDAAYNRAKHEQGKNPRILLLSHPNNPLGISYPKHIVKDCIDWCREKKVHLISDEIYAGSVYNSNDDDDDNFHSALELAKTTNGSSSGGVMGGNLGPYIHFVYALSKDFALSGLRVGVSYSENLEIRTPNQKLNDLCQISSQTQNLVERMLKKKTKENDLWTDGFLKENHDRIRDRNNQLQNCLDDCDLPSIASTAGLFTWIDFSEFLPSGPDDEERERSLYLELVETYGLLLTPGLSMRNERPGFFRCVFTAAKNDNEFQLALRRIKKFVNTRRNSYCETTMA